MPVNYTKAAKNAEAPAHTGAAAAVSSKVTLTKASPTVSLAKQAGQLKVNLNWQARAEQPKQTGFRKLLAGVGSRGIDLDLGCLWELRDGRKGVIQALGNAFGSLDSAPYILLNGDDRSGTNVAGEDMFVNLSHAGEIARILVFACIYDGVPSFDQANGVVTLSPVNGPQIEVRLDDAAGGARMCAIAMIEGTGSELTVRRQVRYIKGSQRALDEAYGWGMNWTRGSK